jgi:hypothetical protein
VQVLQDESDTTLRNLIDLELLDMFQPTFESQLRTDYGVKPNRHAFRNYISFGPPCWRPLETHQATS